MTMSNMKTRYILRCVGTRPDRCVSCKSEVHSNKTATWNKIPQTCLDTSVYTGLNAPKLWVDWIGLDGIGWMDLWMLVCYNVNPLCSDWNGLSELVVVVVWLVVRSPLQCKWGQMSKWDERRCKASLPPPPLTYTTTTSTAVSPPPQSNITNTNSYF